MKSVSNKSVWKGLSYLFSNLPKVEKWFHFVVVAWVIAQLLSSFGMHVHGDTPASALTLVDKFHMYSGIALAPISLIFFTLILKRRTIATMYPWLFMDFAVIKQDIQSLFKLQLPDARPKGLAATVEGLGLLALLLAIATGLLWYVFFTRDGSAPFLLSIHKTAVGAIEAYFYGHAIFALLHLINWMRK
ncbi:cytochrome b/b6 domain-containing protein [Enterovibrio sp. ZSDZ35]|uniref:Cytochrome b/b6 domain-containing protein n=1 Tax=Enterovibrio qingdaonensis TaxID=2899818 RepID=A0ABT5QGB9_9GAMM|nr:cytochrome b/b6 domain-containing protein [Enterovibrio sp. ZSDZ35]MDD1779899.1 cytochrome b/b6 domain-containing protein [Enterovibrio sp. ZSDZ35]